jgi:hypothetical protein
MEICSRVWDWEEAIAAPRLPESSREKVSPSLPVAVCRVYHHHKHML